MFRINKSIIKKNLTLSLIFGLIMGLIFPVFASFFVTFNSFTDMVIFSLLCVLAGIIVGVTAFSITKITIIKVIKEIDNQMNNLVKGDGDPAKGIKLESSDVIGSLINNFNSFLISADTMSVSLKKIIDRDGMISDKLMNQYESTLDSEKMIASHIDEISSHFNESDVKINESAQYLKKMKIDTVDLVMTIKDQKKDIESSTETMDHVSTSIDKTTGIIDKQSEDTKSLLEIIKNSEKKSLETDKHIDQISTETNQIVEIKNRLMKYQNVRICWQ